ncbi:MAG: histidine phosphatase family protein [Ruminococcus sp.]
MKIIFVRHGSTCGNLKKRYIGRTEEELCREGINQLTGRNYPDCELVISSPMKRCTQTAELIYPHIPIKIYRDLRECDFGSFEGKNYIDLTGNQDYQRWIDSGGMLPFPEGEAHDSFVERTVSAFNKAVRENSDCDNMAFTIHGGSIMAIMERYAVPEGGFYDFSVPNGGGYICEYDGEKINVSEYL